MELLRVFRKWLEGGGGGLDSDDVEGKKEYLLKITEILPTLTSPITETKIEPKIEHVENTSMLEVLNSVLRRDLKLIGQIGEPNQKDKLSFVGVHNQMKEAEERGYVDKEIISAVIRVMTASLPLRKFLEATSLDNITLSLLKKYLRSHFHEKSAQELYGELDKLTQTKGEDAMSFLFRAFELEAKVCLAAEASKYPTMVRGLTLQTIETGLSQENESIRNQLRPFLHTSGVTADELTAQMRIIMAAEKNRSSKLATVESNLSRKQVNLVESNHPSAELLATIKSLTDKVASITKLETSVSCLQKELELMRNPKETVSKN